MLCMGTKLLTTLFYIEFFFHAIPPQILKMCKLWKSANYPTAKMLYAMCVKYKSENQMNVRLKIQRGPFKCKTLGKTKKDAN